MPSEGPGSDMQRRDFIALLSGERKRDGGIPTFVGHSERRWGNS